MSAPVPDTLEEMLDPAWVTQALQPRFPGVQITTVTPGPVISRVSTNARFAIECADGLPDGLAENLCGKGYFGEVGRAFRHAGVPEVNFYQKIAAATGMRTLRSLYAELDPKTNHGVVITEDVIPQGAVFLDARSDFTPDQAAQSLEELAKLHAVTWGKAAYADAEWLESRLEKYLEYRGVADIRVNFEGPIGAGVPDEMRDADRLFAAYRSLAAQVPKASPWSVIHGDAHIGNVYLDGTGRPAFLDWQLVQRGPWYLDVGYHIASALTIDDRRRTEQDLVRHYLEQLAASGIDVPSWDDAWVGIRRGIIHGFYLWGITLKVDPAITSTLLDRFGAAAADHDAFDAIEPTA